MEWLVDHGQEVMLDWAFHPDPGLNKDTDEFKLRHPLLVELYDSNSGLQIEVEFQRGSDVVYNAANDTYTIFAHKDSPLHGSITLPKKTVGKIDLFINSVEPTVVVRVIVDRPPSEWLSDLARR